MFFCLILFSWEHSCDQVSGIIFKNDCTCLVWLFAPVVKVQDFQFTGHATKNEMNSMEKTIKHLIPPFFFYRNLAKVAHDYKTAP